jgi:hypothetical protein
VRWELDAAALHHFFRHHLGIELVIHYVDDFLFVAADREVAQQQMDAALALCAKLGVPMAADKAKGPSARLVLDTLAMEARLPERRLAELRLLLKGWTGRQICSILDLQQLTGKLHFACNVVRASRAWLRRPIGLTTAVQRTR